MSRAPFWMAVLNHPPEKGNVYSVKHGVHGTHFQAWLSYDNEWYRVEKDSDGDGARELGEKVRVTLDLHYVKMIEMD